MKYGGSSLTQKKFLQTGWKEHSDIRIYISVYSIFQLKSTFDKQNALHIIATLIIH